MKRKINRKELAWSFYSLSIALLIHFFAPGYAFVQFFKYVAIFAFIVNLSTAFGIKIPFLHDEKN